MEPPGGSQTTGEARKISLPAGTPSRAKIGAKNLRRAETAVKRPLARRHTLERVGEGGLLGRRERGKPQAGMRQEAAVPVEAPPPPNDKGPGDAGRQAEVAEQGGEFDLAVRPRPQETEMLYASPPDAEIEETHLAHVPDPRQNLPGQGCSWKPSPLALVAHGHLIFGGLHSTKGTSPRTSIAVRLDARRVSRAVADFSLSRVVSARVARGLPAMEGGGAVYRERCPAGLRVISVPTEAPIMRSYWRS